MAYFLRSSHQEVAQHLTRNITDFEKVRSRNPTNIRVRYALKQKPGTLVCTVVLEQSKYRVNFSVRVYGGKLPLTALC